MNGKKLKSIRTKLGLTQAKMGEAVGVAGNTIARWERDEVGISVPVSRLILSIEASETKKKPALENVAHGQQAKR
jgi:transcriptional regulator with XRE-family HTH domain